jgi:Carboxypeptidase regulatory-like domain
MVRGTGISLHGFGRFVTAIVALIALGTCMVLAQTSTATILGVVRDASGALIPGVSITVKHTESGLTRTVISSERGSYNVPLLPVGAYEITTTMPGFKQEVRSGINVVVGQEAVVDLTLEVGAAAEQVTVSEEAPLVNTTTSPTSGVITEQQVKDLPLNGRSFDQLITLNVGVTNTTSNTLNGATWNMFSVAGKRPETNRYTINGVDWIGGAATGQFITPFGASNSLLGVEAMREFNVLTDTYGAEYGKRAGAQVTVVTTSGTNQVHGDAFEYLRNSAFDARNFFDQTIGAPPFKRHQFGGALGGPLKKDKLFLFGTYEAFVQRLSVASASIVPGAFARQGLAWPGNSLGPNNSPVPVGSPVPGLKPERLKYANAFWPLPSTADRPDGSAVAYSNPPNSVGENFGLARFDHVISNKDSFYANYNVDNGLRKVPWGGGGGGAPNFVSISQLHSQTLALKETHVFSSSLVNIATLGYAGTFATLVNAPAVPMSKDVVFLEGGNPGSVIIGGGISAAAPSAIAGIPGNNPNTGIRHYFTYSDDVRFIKGKHSWSMGGWYQRSQQGQAGVALSSAANVAYRDIPTFLRDQPTQAILTRNAPMLGFRTTESAWYVQDDMKLRSNFNLRLGLRHEMTNGWNEVAGRCSNYRYDPGFVIQTNPIVGTSCLDQNHAKLLLQPRVGLAWDPTGTGTWAVRAAFGIHNDLLDNLGIRTQAGMPPYAAREQLTVTNGFLPLLPLQKNVPLPPTCGPGIASPCSIYQPTGVDPNMFTPTIQMWNLSVDRQLGKDLLLQVGYVGSQSYHTNLTMDTNTAPPEVCQNPQGCRSGGVLPASQAAIVPQGTTYMPSRPPVVVNGVTLTQRPNPYVSNTQTWFGQGTASYHALNVSLLKRATRGLTFKANYSYSKVIDMNSAILAPSGENEPPETFSPYSRNLNRGVAAYNLHHQFNTSYSYQLPFGSGQRFGGGASGLLNHLIGGWQWNGIVNVQGGFPITPLIGFNNSGTGDNNVVDVPDWNPDFKGPVILGTVDHWFDPRAFKMPIAGTFGNVGRSPLRGPGLFNVDTSLFKRIPIRESVTLQFRAEAFNVTNHTNFGLPNQVVFQGNSSNYSVSDSAGQITSTANYPRQLQFALKLLF